MDYFIVTVLVFFSIVLPLLLMAVEAGKTFMERQHD